MLTDFSYSGLWFYAYIHAGHRGDESSQGISQSSILVPGSLSGLLRHFRSRCVLVSTSFRRVLIILLICSFSYCGQYVATPSLASAGGTLEKVAYGVSIPGFIMTSTLWVHLAAKFVSTSQRRLGYLLTL